MGAPCALKSFLSRSDEECCGAPAMSGYCQNCKTATAVVHVTEREGGQTVEKHLCEECAEGQGFVTKQQQVSILELFKQLMEGSGSSRTSQDTVCPDCGMTFSEFKAKGRFGCASDYDAFLDKLLPLLQRIHGATEHSFDPGQSRPDVPADPPQAQPAPPQPAESSDDAPAAEEEDQAKASLFLRREELRSQLQEAVDKEDYETAAKLRDAIRELETAIETGDAP